MKDSIINQYIYYSEYINTEIIYTKAPKEEKKLKITEKYLKKHTYYCQKSFEDKFSNLVVVESIKLILIFEEISPKELKDIEKKLVETENLNIIIDKKNSEKILELIKNINIQNHDIYIKNDFKSILEKIINLQKEQYTQAQKEYYQNISESNDNLINHIQKEKDKILDKISYYAIVDIKNFEVVTYNEPFFELFKEELLDENSHDIFDIIKTTNIPDKKEFKEILKEGQNHKQSIEVKTSKTTKLFSIIWIPLEDNNLVVDKVGIYLNEVKEIEKIEVNEIEHTIENTLETTLGMIAHQWRQPLSTVSLIVDDIEIKEILGTLTNEHLKNELTTIKNNVTFLSETIDKFRNFFKKDKEDKIIDTKEEIEKGINTVMNLLKETKIDFNFNLEDELYVNEKEGELQQITLNLIKNSYDAFKPHQQNKKISIKTTRKHGNIMILFSDNAGGIPKQIEGRIWEPYFSTKKDLNGTGLGLYMVKSMVENDMGGKILLKNSNKGVDFIIIIPEKEKVKNG